MDWRRPTLRSPYGKVVMLLLVMNIVLLAKLLKLLEKKNYGPNLSDKIEKIRKTDYRAGKDFHDDDIAMRTNLLKYVARIEEDYLRDSSGLYTIIPNFVIPYSGVNNETLSLCSQTSANHLQFLIKLCDNWSGPVSIAVFTYGYEAALAVYYISQLHACFKNIQKSVRFHLVYPTSDHPVNLNILRYTETRCDNFGSFVFDNKANFDGEIPFPHNMLRNVAVRYSLATYISVIDIDLIPSLDLHKSFSKFINRRMKSGLSRNEHDTERIAYILPAFESKIERNIVDKDYLLKEWDVKNVRIYYETRCKMCQIVTNYDKWRLLAKEPLLDVGYFVKWDKNWEPFYISRKEYLPLWDERFQQFGYDRISQVCELHVAGYKFAVLNKAFLVHRGFKEPVGKNSKQITQLKRNIKLFEIFKEHLQDRYPNSSRKC